jgi:hypothetical protein
MARHVSSGALGDRPTPLALFCAGLTEHAGGGSRDEERPARTGSTMDIPLVHVILLRPGVVEPAPAAAGRFSARSQATVPVSLRAAERGSPSARCVHALSLDEGLVYPGRYR